MRQAAKTRPGATAEQPSRLAVTLRALMGEAGFNQKSLATAAGVNETYVRDILQGRSKNPRSRELALVAKALGVSAESLRGAAAPETVEYAKDAQELVLLRSFRHLTEDEKSEIIGFIEFRLARRAAGEPAAQRKAV